MQMKRKWLTIFKGTYTGSNRTCRDCACCGRECLECAWAPRPDVITCPSINCVGVQAPGYQETRLQDFSPSVKGPKASLCLSVLLMRLPR